MASSGVNHLSQPCIYGQLASSYAERKSRFMKWLSKLFKSGGSGRGVIGGQHPQFLGDENMVWRVPPRSLDGRPRSDKEKEDLDHAIALSLAEDLKRPKGYGWRSDTDEDLSRSLHDSLNTSSYPPYAPTPYYPSGYRVCGACKQDIGFGNYLGCMGTFFHPECFRCRSCGYPITEHEIPTNGAGLIEYRCHPFWSQKYCPSHEHDNVARCCSCERLESWNARYISLGDGRSLCLECMESAIMDTGDCHSLYHAIRDFFEGMNMKLDQEIPMLLVERQALNEAIVGEKNGHHHLPETRGLCLSEEQTVKSIQVLRRPRLAGQRLVGMRSQPQKLTRKCEVTAILVLYGLPRYCPKSFDQVFPLSTLLGVGHCSFPPFYAWEVPNVGEIASVLGCGVGKLPVTYLALLLNAPFKASAAWDVVERLLTGAILAHELMHGWLRLKGFRNLSPEVEEGICQVLSYMWLESEVMPGFNRNMASTSSGAASSSSSSSKKGGKSEVEKKLGEFFMHQIAHDVSPAYGEGFRAANAAVNKFGLRITLDHIRLTGSFPL
ncbi:Protein DA1-related 2 [Vitis vinifera]|uniref:Protein DA1-related 2 n=1 Tax=Vitis vinifera TaxID=29760 RepID=A0A438ENI0_VITVI|nr:Protein DA1-related 2 [Vitis vinifera]